MPGLDHGDPQTGLAGVERRGETHRSATGDQQVGLPGGPVMARQRQRREGGGLDAEAYRQQRDVEHREDQGRDPRRVHQGQGEALDDDGDVVRVPQAPGTDRR